MDDGYVTPGMDEHYPSADESAHLAAWEAAAQSATEWLEERLRIVGLEVLVEDIARTGGAEWAVRGAGGMVWARGSAETPDELNARVEDALRENADREVDA